MLIIICNSSSQVILNWTKPTDCFCLIQWGMNHSCAEAKRQEVLLSTANRHFLNSINERMINQQIFNKMYTKWNVVNERFQFVSKVMFTFHAFLIFRLNKITLHIVHLKFSGKYQKSTWAELNGWTEYDTKVNWSWSGAGRYLLYDYLRLRRLYKK